MVSIIGANNPFVKERKPYPGGRSGGNVCLCRDMLARIVERGRPACVGVTAEIRSVLAVGADDLRYGNVGVAPARGALFVRQVNGALRAGVDTGVARLAAIPEFDPLGNGDVRGGADVGAKAAAGAVAVHDECLCAPALVLLPQKRFAIGGERLVLGGCGGDAKS